MAIQWFPGHMTKALRELAQNLKKVDAVLYVLDARAPISTLNPELSKMVSEKPIIYILSKADMADPDQTKKWLDYFNKMGNKALAIDSTKSNTKKIIISAIKEVLSPKIEKNRQKGFNATLRVCVIGVPNTGKSTLINTLAQEVVTKTGNIVGVTRSIAWRKIENWLEVMDTAGTLWPKFEDEQVANKLAFIGSISDNVLDTTEVAIDLLELLKNIVPKSLTERYTIPDIALDNITLLEDICKKRGYIFRGGEIDYERGGKAILDDFRKTRIGKITLDRFEDFF